MVSAASLLPDERDHIRGQLVSTTSWPGKSPSTTRPVLVTQSRNAEPSTSTSTRAQASSSHPRQAPMTSTAQGKAGPSNSLLHRLAGPSDQKAGLGRTREQVAQVSYEVSKGSKYFLQQEEKDAQLTIRVEKLVAKLDERVQERHGNLANEEQYVDEMLEELEKTRCLTETVCVVDADAFYASCHQREDPSLVGKAFGVGGGSGGGVLTTASYEARKYGCSSAMAGFVAKRLCPHIIFVKPDFSLYTSASKSIMNILKQYGELSPASLDEAYISLTEYCKRERISPATAAERIRAQVLAETKLTVSAGVSPNAMLSKVAADKNKPNGQCVIDPTREACMAFASSLPIRKIPGIGRVSERILHAVGVFTVADIHTLRGKLFLIRKEIGLSFLLRAYLGLGRTTIQKAKRGSRKSIGVERTFTAQSDMDFLYSKLKNISESLAEDCRKLEYSGRTLTLKIKTHTFHTFSRAKTLGSSIYFSDADTFLLEGKRLLDKEIADRAKAVARGQVPKGGKQLSLRLIGLKLSNLRDERSMSKKKGNLSDWAGDGKPTNADLKPDVIDLLSDDEEDAADDHDDSNSRPSAPDDFIREDDVKMEDDDVLAHVAPIDSKTMPASSDPLWAAIDAEGFIDFDDENSYSGYDRLEKCVEDDVRLSNKPFFTIGESLNSRVIQTSPTPMENRLTFNGTGTSAQVQQPSSSGAGAMVCPVCQKSFVGTEIALSAHVEQHFAKPPLKPKLHRAAIAPSKSSALRTTSNTHGSASSRLRATSSSRLKSTPAGATLLDAFRQN
ncbi:hypothetical protein OIO90_003398 [Microbotryomycetes sp. JL221]|nr:hypothetical protein OIO90_003398 [Microbotryomycetes sp. JL221]